MATIAATIIHGLGIASGTAPGAGGPENGTIRLQKPFLRHHVPEIANCYDGTINLLLDTPFEIRIPDHVTPPIKWRPDDPSFDERFGLTAVWLELNGATHRAWIYTAEKSQHLLKTGVVELLAQRLDGVQYGVRCAITIDRGRPGELLVV